MILLDMMLPKLSGPDVLRALKRDARTNSIPVVVLSSLSQKNKQKLMQEGAAGFIEKSDELMANNSAALVRILENTLRE